MKGDAQEVRRIAASEAAIRDARTASLDRRYGKIGISAVAAALPYQSDAKNPAYAPVVPRERRAGVRRIGGGLIMAAVARPSLRARCRRTDAAGRDCRHAGAAQSGRLITSN